MRGRCDTCGNDYDKAFQIMFQERLYTFDAFECAIHALAPTCRQCGCRIVGHGIESSGTFYCCANCARLSGTPGARDRIA